MIINSAVVQIQIERKLGYNLVIKDLTTLRETFTDDAELISVTTGESITMQEVARVLGILEGLKENQFWEVDIDFSNI